MVVKIRKQANVIGSTTLEDIVKHHVLDSVIPIKTLKTLINDYQLSLLADLGTGIGFPGIPVAILMSTFKMLLLETKAKKLFFLNQIIKDLRLSNVIVKHSDEVRPKLEKVLVLTRAFGDLYKILKVSRKYFKNSIIAAYKRRSDKIEEEIINNYVKNSILVIKPLESPFIDTERHLVVLKI